MMRTNGLHRLGQPRVRRADTALVQRTCVCLRAERAATTTSELPTQRLPLLGAREPATRLW